MAQRLVKIILPEEHGKNAQELLRIQESLSFWQEESADGNFVISALTDSGSSEKIMDLFERKYASVSGFRLVLLPVEASLPRTDIPDDNLSASIQVKTKTEQKVSIRISREELYSDIADSTKLSNIFVLLTILSTIVVAIGLLKNNVAVIIGALANRIVAERFNHVVLTGWRSTPAGQHHMTSFSTRVYPPNLLCCQ